MTDEQKTETPAAEPADAPTATTPLTEPAAEPPPAPTATTPLTEPAAEPPPAPTATTPIATTPAAPSATPPAAPAQNPINLVLFGTLMLVVGMLAGYFGRPLITQAVSDQALRDSGAAVAEPAPADAPASDPSAADAGTGSADAPATGEQGAVPTPTDADMQQLMTFLVDNTRHFKGDPNAPVTIIEFSDFQCPYCSQFANEAGKQLEAEYIDTGLVRFGYLHYPFLGEGSVTSAEASECAADQGEFWAYHDRLVERVAVEGQRDFTPETLASFAAELDLDTAAFDECFNGGTHTATIQEATTLAQTIGVRSTPTFLINGEPLLGAQQYEAFEQVIEQELAAAGATGE